MGLPQNQMSDVPLESAELTDDVMDRLHSRDNEDGVFWSAVRAGARAERHRPEPRYLDWANDGDLLKEIMK
jgi:hypothetical protein